jgi:hypothetical protein
MMLSLLAAIAVLWASLANDQSTLSIAVQQQFGLRHVAQRRIAGPMSRGVSAPLERCVLGWIKSAWSASGTTGTGQLISIVPIPDTNLVTEAF